MRCKMALVVGIVSEASRFSELSDTAEKKINQLFMIENRST
jgi:hypothetical protein